MAMYQRIARLSLLGSVVVLMTIPLCLIVTPVIGIKPPLVLGVVLLFAFVVIGNLCGDQADDKRPNTNFPKWEVEAIGHCTALHLLQGLRTEGKLISPHP